MQTIPVAVLVSHTVESYDQWKAAFDAHAGARKAAGILGHHINRAADDPRALAVFLPAVDRKRLEAFVESADLKSTMRDAGVTGAPTLTWLKPVEDRHIDDRPTASMIIVHDVADFAAWKKVYDAAEPLRARHGIIGAAVNQALDNPNTVIVYHQAETRAALEGLLADPELKATMQRAGVTSAPQVRFVDALDGGEDIAVVTVPLIEIPARIASA
jgi:hypothetical protein